MSYKILSSSKTAIKVIWGSVLIRRSQDSKSETAQIALCSFVQNIKAVNEVQDIKWCLYHWVKI